MYTTYIYIYRIESRDGNVNGSFCVPSSLAPVFFFIHAGKTQWACGMLRLWYLRMDPT